VSPALTFRCPAPSHIHVSYTLTLNVAFRLYSKRTTYRVGWSLADL